MLGTTRLAQQVGKVMDEWGKTVDDKYVVRVIYKERQFCIASRYSREEHLHEMLGQTQKAGLN